MDYEIIEALKEAIEEYKARNELKSFIKSELIKAINGDKWITIKGNHIPVEDDKTKPEAAEDFVKEKKEENNSKTTQEEKQKKIDSVKIDPNKDNILPELNKEEQEKLGVGNIPVRLKQKIYNINQKHNDVNKGDDNYIIGSALYDPENVIPSKTPNYFHFIKRVYNDRNSFVLLDVNVDENEGYLDIVHYYYTNDKNRKRTEKNH